jgi:uncharacterized protein (TIGR03067 family)
MDLPRLSLASISILILAAGAQKESDKADREKLQGNWVVESLEVNGKDVPPDNTNKLEVVIKGTKIVFKGENNNEEFAFSIDPNKKPKTIDMISSHKEVGTLQGIYTLDGDKLKICYGRKEKDRPGEFVTARGDRRVFMVLRRGK